jgi:hypothetical protein
MARKTWVRMTETQPIQLSPGMRRLVAFTGRRSLPKLNTPARSMRANIKQIIISVKEKP